MTTMVDVVVGGQYGSEAKGHVTAQLVTQAAHERDSEQGNHFGIDVWNIRVAGPNAGHTAYDSEGRKFAFRTLPIGAVIDDKTQLYIAPGSEIDLPVLYKEIQEAEAAGHIVRGRLYMSRQATLIEDGHKLVEQGADLVGKVGSTGKGIGAARADRIMRTASLVPDAFTDGPDGDLQSQPWAWAEPEELYASDHFAHTANQHIIIEGTQGYGLSLRASGNYPQVTSSDCRSIDFLAMAGIDPTRCDTQIQNWVVCRVFPIRVAGNSGPMKGETSWAELGLEEEKTTVTQKVRRVGMWDQDLVAAAVQANGGHNANVVITMIDQVIPGFDEVTPEILEKVQAGEITGDAVPRALDEAIEWINAHASAEQIGAPIAAFTYSPTQIVFTQAALRRRGEQGGGGLADALAQAFESALIGEDEN
ncbi:PurA-like adenylosuccinate synthetase [Microbacterium phage Theresita]|nr:PurA-like adenylosuccinate synthetase [Microbacterium phage Theresita]